MISTLSFTILSTCRRKTRDLAASAICLAVGFRARVKTFLHTSSVFSSFMLLSLSFITAIQQCSEFWVAPLCHHEHLANVVIFTS